MSEESPEVEALRKIKQNSLRVGDYLLFDMDTEHFGITHGVTGESGIFRKDEFLPYVSAFFGLHF